MVGYRGQTLTYKGETNSQVWADREWEACGPLNVHISILQGVIFSPDVWVDGEWKVCGSLYTSVQSHTVFYFSHMCLKGKIILTL